MRNESRIRRVARLLIEKHGEEALAIAVARAQQRLAIEDYGSAAIWAQVSEAIHVIAPALKPKTSKKLKRHAEPSLDELIDDPVMEAVTRGDAARREAVRDTLRRAKRRRRKRVPSAE